MNQAYCVLHITPYKGLNRIGAHLDRTQVPKNAEASRTHLNEELAPRAKATLTADVQARIEEGYTSKRKIRKDARLALGIIMTGSHERMKEIEKDKKLFEAWKKANYKFACQHFGKDNIVRFTLHRDEKTPHFHCVFVPITPDGRLAAKDFVSGQTYGAGKEKLRKYQDDYAKAMQPFGLERGLPIERTAAKHLTTAQYYRSMHAIKEHAKKQAAPIKASNVLRLKEVRKGVEHALINAHRTAMDRQAARERMIRDYRKELARKLEKVKKEANLILHLASMGYKLNKQETTTKAAVFEKGAEKLIVSMQRNRRGYFTYRAAKDPQDRGTIVDFMQKRDYKLSAICNISTKHLDRTVLEALPKKADKVVPAKKKALPDKEQALAQAEATQQDPAPLIPHEDAQEEEEAQRKKKKKKRRTFMGMTI